MPSFGPVSRRDLIRYLKLAGFSGPRADGKHSIMKRGDITIRIPILIVETLEETC